MFFKDLCILVLWTKVISTLEGLSSNVNDHVVLFDLNSGTYQNCPILVGTRIATIDYLRNYWIHYDKVCD